VLRCGSRLAELETYIDADRLSPSAKHARWFLASTGHVLRRFAMSTTAFPRPLKATYAAFVSLRRWIHVAAPCLQAFPELIRVERLLLALRRRRGAAAKPPQFPLSQDPVDYPDRLASSR
jgi:hypothetical protein